MTEDKFRLPPDFVAKLALSAEQAEVLSPEQARAFKQMGAQQRASIRQAQFATNTLPPYLREAIDSYRRAQHDLKVGTVPVREVKARTESLQAMQAWLDQELGFKTWDPTRPPVPPAEAPAASPPVPEPPTVVRHMWVTPVTLADEPQQETVADLPPEVPAAPPGPFAGNAGPSAGEPDDEGSRQQEIDEGVAQKEIAANVLELYPPDGDFPDAMGPTELRNAIIDLHKRKKAEGGKPLEVRSWNSVDRYIKRHRAKRHRDA